MGEVNPIVLCVAQQLGGFSSLFRCFEEQFFKEFAQPDGGSSFKQRFLSWNKVSSTCQTGAANFFPTFR